MLYIGTKKTVLVLFLTILLTFSLTGIAFAGIGSYVVMESETAVYEYDFIELLNSFNQDGLIWKDFSSKMTIYGTYAMSSVVGDSKSYVSFRAVLEAFNGGQDPIAYLDSTAATLATMPAMVNFVTIGLDGKLLITAKPTGNVVGKVSKMPNTPFFGSTLIKVELTGTDNPQSWTVKIEGVNIPYNTTYSCHALAVEANTGMDLNTTEQLQNLLQITATNGGDDTTFEVVDIY